MGLGHIFRQCSLLNMLNIKNINFNLVIPVSFKSDKSRYDLITDRINENYILSGKDAVDKMHCTKNNIIIIDNYKFEYVYNKFREKSNLPNIKYIRIDDIAYRKMSNNPHTTIIPNLVSKGQEKIIKQFIDNNYQIKYGREYIINEPKMVISENERLDILNLRKNRIQNKKTELNLMISFGGTITNKICALEAERLTALIKLLKSNFSEIKINVIGDYGASIANKANIKYNYINWLQPLDLINLYKKSDLYIGSIGYSMWERVVQLLPSIVMPISQNQKEYLQVGIDLNIHKDISIINENIIEDIDNMIDSCFSQKTAISGYNNVFKSLYEK